MAQQYAVRNSYLLTPDEKLERAALAIVAWIFALALIPLWIFTAEVLGVHSPIFWGTFIGVASWTLLVSWTLHFFMVRVPLITGLITTNLLRSIKPGIDDFYNQHVYLPGWNFKFPWEESEIGQFLSLRVVTQVFQEDFPAEDGVLVQFRGSFQYMPLPRLLPLHIQVDDTTIKQGLVDIITSYLSAKVHSQNSRDARGAVETHSQGIDALFQDVRRDATESFETKYGIDLILSKLADAGYEPTYQKALTSKQVAQRLQEIAERLKEERGLEEKDAMNAAMIINGDVTKEIVEVEGNAGEALAGLLLKLGQGGPTTTKRRG